MTTLHENLVEECARAVSTAMYHDPSFWLICENAASAVLAVVQKRLQTVTEEQLHACHAALRTHLKAIPVEERILSKDDKARIRWRAMLAASPLFPGGTT